MPGWRLISAVGLVGLVGTSLCFGMGFSPLELRDLLRSAKNPFQEAKTATEHYNQQGIDSMKAIEALDPENPPVLNQKNLWACTCTNLTYQDQVQRGCSKGYAFDTVTAATHYAQAHCGTNCEARCSSSVMR